MGWVGDDISLYGFSALLTHPRTTDARKEPRLDQDSQITSILVTATDRSLFLGPASPVWLISTNLKSPSYTSQKNSIICAAILKGFLVHADPKIVSTGAVTAVPGQNCTGNTLTRDGLVVCRTVFGPKFWPCVVEPQGLRIKTGRS